MVQNEPFWFRKELMRSITIHNLDSDLDALIRQKAEEYSWSLNKTIKKLLRDALSLTLAHKKKNDFSEFIGTMSAMEAEELNKIINDEFEKIDEEDWK